MIFQTIFQNVSAFFQIGAANVRRNFMVSIKLSAGNSLTIFVVFMWGFPGRAHVGCEAGGKERRRVRDLRGLLVRLRRVSAAYNFYK